MQKIFVISLLCGLHTLFLLGCSQKLEKFVNFEKMPFEKPFVFDDIAKYLDRYDEEHKGYSKALRLCVADSGTYYIGKAIKVSMIPFHPPSYFVKYKDMLLVVYDVKKGYLKHTDFNKDILQTYKKYLVNDLLMDYRLILESVKDKKGHYVDRWDTSWVLRSFFHYPEYDCWKIIKKNGKYTFTKDLFCQEMDKIPPDAPRHKHSQFYTPHEDVSKDIW
jgi:hypothetical protein